MNILVIQCLRGNAVGQVKIEQISSKKEFYYFYNKDVVNNKEFEKSGQVLLVQYKKNEEKNELRDKICCGMAFGTYEKIEDTKEYGEKGLLKIKIKKIEFKIESENNNLSEEKYNILEKDAKQINLKVFENNSFDINQINISDDIFDSLKQFFDRNDSLENEDKELENIQNLYKKFHEDKNEYKKDKNFDENEKKKLEEIFESYDELERKEKLDDLAQKSIYARRVIKGDRKANRTEYQRDWERIIHAKAFRRLEDKAQIYTLSKGDHFRTRLTHTLEVTQIARGIARELHLNEDLVEAIALGHDLGHTPFGHAGERTLNKILKNEGVKGGFKHNFQGVKVVNYLEEKYKEFEGIDLTYQVMEGILKHTKISDCKRCSEYHSKEKKCYYSDPIKALNCEKNSYEIAKFLCKGDINKLHPEYSFATTLEGQVVAVADEIAQRAHDLDDGIASGIINEKEFLEEVENIPILKKLYNKIKKSLEDIDEYKREYIDTLDIKRARIISDVITYFIAEIVKQSKAHIKKYKNEMGDIDYSGELVIKENLISFDYNDSEDKSYIEKVREKLEEITSNKIINSEEVNCFDGKGEYIIKKLYKAYITNPRQMSKTTLTRIKREMSRYTNDEFDITKIYIKDHDTEGKVKFDKKDEVEKVKHKVFVRCIIDLISGMTDEFANKQFEKLYSPRTY